MVGGWQRVFPRRVPLWANKVRNYFNATPKWLRRFDEALSAEWLSKAQKYIRLEKRNTGGKAPTIHPAEPGIHELADLYAVMLALSGDVYIGDSNRIWYQMSPGGTIYHYGKEPTLPAAEAAWATAITQNFCPVFKLVSPDGTGGSQECCIKNPVIGRVLVGGTIWADLRGSYIEDGDVSNRIVTDPVLQGSYNYSETVEVGLAAHELRDVKPHSSDPSFYSNPFPMSSALSMRQFPVDDNNREILVHQK
jgi:hypothetical protein